MAYFYSEKSVFTGDGPIALKRVIASKSQGKTLDCAAIVAYNVSSCFQTFWSFNDGEKEHESILYDFSDYTRLDSSRRLQSVLLDANVLLSVNVVVNGSGSRRNDRGLHGF
jgi:hypothetical protein